MTRRLLFYLFAFFIPLVLGACSSTDQPRQIAAYPSRVGQGETRFMPPPDIPRNTLVVYNAFLEMSVWNVDSAAERASQIAYENGGYLSSSQSWFRDGRKHTTLMIAVPADRFEKSRTAVLRLGVLESERVSGDLVPTGYDRGAWPHYSQITVQLRPRAAMALPSLDESTWRPVRTMSAAFSVFMAIFGFLVDVIIWLIVVGGPFVLLGWGIRAMVRRWRKGSNSG